MQDLNSDEVRLKIIIKTLEVVRKVVRKCKVKFRKSTAQIHNGSSMWAEDPGIYFDGGLGIWIKLNLIAMLHSLIGRWIIEF